MLIDKKCSTTKHCPCSIIEYLLELDLPGWRLQVSKVQLQCDEYACRLAPDAPRQANSLPRGSSRHRGHSLHHDILC